PWRACPGPVRAPRPCYSNSRRPRPASRYGFCRAGLLRFLRLGDFAGSPASFLATLLRVPFARKNIRLAPQNYLGHGIYFVTICSYNRSPHFADASLGHVTLGHLISLAARRSFLLHAFCLMPDHLHFLVEGSSQQSNLLPFIMAFKQRTSLAHKNRAAGPLWQTKFYDHILRAPDEL